MKIGGGQFAPKSVVILNWNQVVTLNWNWVVNITGICILARSYPLYKTVENEGDSANYYAVIEFYKP
jgi:hypothetical protein